MIYHEKFYWLLAYITERFIGRAEKSRGSESNTAALGGSPERSAQDVRRVAVSSS